MEILRGGSYGSWLMFSCLQIWISKLLLSFTVFTPEDACEYLEFLKALNLSPCHYGYRQLADVQTRCKISQKALGGLQCLPSPLTIHRTHNWSSILVSRFPFDKWENQGSHAEDMMSSIHRERRKLFQSRSLLTVSLDLLVMNDYLDFHMRLRGYHSMEILKYWSHIWRY